LNVTYNQDMDLSIIEHLLVNRCRLKKSSPLVMGVSGGPDSLCLLDVLFRLGYKPVVAHFDHKIRVESGEDIEFVRRVAAGYNLPLDVGAGDIPAMAQEKRISIEAAARIARYGFLFAAARRWNAQALVVAHTADDQVETLLLHLLRGSGLDGLLGMDFRAFLPEWGDKIALVRPLLATWRAEVESYCQDQGIEVLTDATNRDTYYTRNRIRLELIPQLETYNPKVRKALWRLAENLRMDVAVLLPLQEKAWQSCCLETGEDRVLLDAVALRGLEEGLRRWVVRNALKTIPLGDELDHDLVEQVLSFIKTPSRSRQMELAAGFVCRLVGEGLIFCLAGYSPSQGNYPAIPAGQEMILQIPAMLVVEQDWSLCVELIKAELPTWVPETVYKAYVDGDKLVGDLSLRTSRPGDRYSPLGMGGKSTKLSDLFINRHLPKDARATLPLVCDCQGIVWVSGYPPAERVCITSQTRRVVMLHWVKGK
jgi:tRNA(Ile)-lysidine synthase